jgi:DNA sulfur modification protein DndD
MVFTKVELEDFGCYEGQQVLELGAHLDGEKNLVVIGGLNGAGKTTFLDAVTFGLFGHKDGFEHIKRIGPKGKDLEKRGAYLARLLNRAAFREGRRVAAVTLHLLDSDRDGDHRITICREWLFDDNLGLKSETLQVLRDGETLEDEFGGEPAGRFADYLKHSIPANVGPFFMFDGEEIQRLAQSDLGKEVQDGIDALLGFHVLKKLEQDLEKQHTEYQRGAQKRTQQEDELAELRVKERRLSNEVEARERESKALLDQIDGLKARLAENKATLDRLLGPEGKRQSELRTDLERTREKIGELRRQTESLVEDFIIPALPTALVRSLGARLDGEDLYRSWDEGRRRVQPQLERLILEVFGPEAPRPVLHLTEDQRRFLVTLLRERWDGLFHPKPEGVADDIRHDRLTAEELAQVRSKWVAVVHRQAPDLNGLLNRLDEADRRASRLEGLLESASAEEEIEAMLRERDQLSRELGEANAVCEAKSRETDALANDLRVVRRDLRNKQDDLDESGQDSQLALLARNVRRAVARYQELLRPRKRDEIRRHLRDMYRRLARKEDVVQDIDLDEQTYNPRLLDRRGKPIPITEFSAGEREIFALALLWALAKTSRRELPVVIDTPLGRLDSQHRNNIVTQYLPAAGTQVFVLSTDTELDRRYFDRVRDHVAKAFRLNFDSIRERTIIEDGYFDNL